MAITFTKQPSGIYPAYNDSFIEFSSDLANNYKTEITVYPTTIFTKPFVVYPDINGVYLFNLKESVKVVMNQSGFKDSNFDTTVFYKSITGLNLLQQIGVKVISDVTEEISVKTFDFFKSVKQVGETIFYNPLQVLSNSKNGIDYELTYFEGYPFSIDLQQVLTGSKITVKSLNTGNVTEEMIATLNDSFRFNIDNGGGENWSAKNFFTLTNGVNRLEVYADNVFKTNIRLNKIKACEGVYLKWFNSQGGYSHFLFNKYFINQIQGAETDRLLNNEFENVGNTFGNFRTTGKNTVERLTIKKKYSKAEYEVLKDIFKSPFIQMYSSKVANIEGFFIDVSISGSMAHSNKREFNNINLVVDLPEIITAKL